MPEAIPRRSGRPPRVNRAQVVAAAAALLTDAGPSGFSMRSLATRLNMSPMGIYHYFDSKNDLLGAVLAHQSWSDPTPELPAEPIERVLTVATVVIDHLARNPWIMDLQVSTESVDQFSAWGADTVLGACEELGMDTDHRITFLAALWRLVLAEATIRAGAAQLAAATGRTERESLTARLGSFAQLPHLRRAVAEAPAVVERFRIESVIRSLLGSNLVPPRDPDAS